MTLSHAATKSRTNFSPRVVACVDLRQRAQLGVASRTRGRPRWPSTAARRSRGRGPRRRSRPEPDAFHSVLMSSRFDEEVVGQRPRPVGEDAVPGLPEVRVQRAHAADQHRHLRRGQPQHVGALEQPVLERQRLARAEVVAEAVDGRLEHGERLDVGLLLRGVRAPRRERDGDVVAGVPRRLLDGRAPAEDDQVGQRDPLGAGLRVVELLLDPLERLAARSRAAAGSFASQSFCGARRRRAPFAPPRLSVPRNEAADAQAVATSRGIDSPEARIFSFSAATSSCADQLVVDRGDGVLPQLRLRHPRAEVARRPGPCRGAAACTTPSRTRPRARPDARRSAWRSARRSGSSLSARSVVSIIGAWRLDGSWASGTVPWASASLGVHCFAPAGLVVSSQS